MTRAMISAAALVLVTGAHAEPLPQPAGPGGSCPFGYFTSGSYCVPSQGAQDAVPKGAERHVPVWVDEQRQLLPAERALTVAGGAARQHEPGSELSADRL